MSLKAGRVGVAPDQVDEFGVIKSEATSGYTKQEADAKFETKTDANTEHAKLQPKILTIPISMLEGSSLVPKTTVEAVIQTMDNAMTNRELTEKCQINQLTSSINLNDIVADGYRGFWGTSLPTNTPENKQNCFIEVLNKNDVVMQRVTRAYEGMTYVRIYQNQWYSWYKFTGTIVS